MGPNPGVEYHRKWLWSILNEVCRWNIVPDFFSKVVVRNTHFNNVKFVLIFGFYARIDGSSDVDFVDITNYDSS